MPIIYKVSAIQGCPLRGVPPCVNFSKIDLESVCTIRVVNS